MITDLIFASDSREEQGYFKNAANRKTDGLVDKTYPLRAGEPIVQLL